MLGTAAALLNSKGVTTSSSSSSLTLPAEKMAAAAATQSTDDNSSSDISIDSSQPVEDHAALESIKSLLASNPILLRHSAHRSSSSDEESSSSQLPEGKPSQLRLIDRRIYYDWKNDRAPDQNRKYVRLREISKICAGLGPKVMQLHQRKCGGLTPPNSELQHSCFHILFISSSNQEAATAALAAGGGPLKLPELDELNLQTNSEEDRHTWMRGLQLLLDEFQAEQ